MSPASAGNQKILSHLRGKRRNGGGGRGARAVARRSGLRNENRLAVVRQFADRLADVGEGALADRLDDVGEGSVAPVFGGGVDIRARVPAPGKLFDARHVDVSIVQPAV